jgi:cobalt/nickel transport protein
MSEKERTMKKILFGIVAALCPLLYASMVSAHYGMIIPSDQMVMQGDDRTITLDLRFWHPMEGIPMPLAKPAHFDVYANGKKVDLLDTLVPQKVKDNQTWKAEYKIKRPGLYVFTMEPQPYWEPAEDKFIIHYTKAVVTAFGSDEGWDKPVGLKTEIVPLSKPYGLYTGNVFQGIVLMNGKPVPFSEVEIEYYNQDGSHEAPNDYMVTQTIKADKNGVFTYGVPMAGWWGFAALNPSDTPLQHDGKDKEVELGAVLWVNFVDMK